MPPIVRGSKNLGLVQAIFVGVNPPLNNRIIWFDDNIAVKIHKRYNFQTATWEPFGTSPEVVNGIYTYIAYATDCDGGDFSLVKQEDSTHYAVITSSVAIPNPNLIASLFAGRWTKYCSAVENTGNYTYIRYADNCEGANFSADLLEEVPCEVCSYVDEISVVDKSNTINATISSNVINVTFTNAIIGNFIDIELKRGGTVLASNLKYNVITDKSVGWLGVVNLSFDPNSDEFVTIDSSTPDVENYLKVINGGRVRISIPNNTNKSSFTGSLQIQIGSETCKTEPTICYKCRAYVGFINSDTPIEPDDIVKSLFDGKWIPLGSCDCGSSEDLENVFKQIKYLNELINSTLDSQNAQILTIQNGLNEINVAFGNYVISNNSALSSLNSTLTSQISLLQSQVNDLSTYLDNNIDVLNSSIAENLVEAKAYADNLADGLQEQIDNINSILESYGNRLDALENPTP